MLRPSESQLSQSNLEPMITFVKYIATLLIFTTSITLSAQNAADTKDVCKSYSDIVSSNIENPSLVGDDDFNDTVLVSILTCAPGSELYSRFGHTALRVKMTRQYIDVVFNYGCFNYNADNFVLKFLLGQTDYLLEYENYDNFIRRYESMGQEVKEQVLNLTIAEKNRLIELLKDNLQPCNQEYRYVWLYDNCTERARDIVESAIQGKVIYNRKTDPRTVRQMLRDVLSDSPWVSFGIDMILGQEIDATPDKRVQMFLPAFYSQEIAEATIRSGSNQHEMVKKQRTLLHNETPQENTPNVLLHPTFIFLAFLVLIIFVSSFEITHAKYFWGLDVVLHTLQGLAGLLIAFLYFFSTHPGVDSNWLVVMFNPLWIVYACWIARCHKKKKKNVLGVANMIVAASFLMIMAISQQSYQMAMYFIVSTFMLRACVQGHFMCHAQFKHRASSKKGK